MKFKRLNSDYKRLENELNSNLNLFFNIVNNRKLGSLTKKQKNMIIELSFLKVYRTWESFLHETMTDILLYKQRNVKVSRIEVRDREHIEELISLGWSYPKFDIKNVTKMEHLFLKVNIYRDAMSSRSGDLDNMKRMRDMAAHEGNYDSAIEFYNDVVNRTASHLVLNKADIKMLPGSLLKSKDRTRTTYYFQRYMEVIRDIAKEVVEKFNSI